jgi:hypothetical protein
MRTGLPPFTEDMSGNDAVIAIIEGLSAYRNGQEPERFSRLLTKRERKAFRFALAGNGSRHFDSCRSCVDALGF